MCKTRDGRFFINFTLLVCLALKPLQKMSEISEKRGNTLEKENTEFRAKKFSKPLTTQKALSRLFFKFPNFRKLSILLLRWSFQENEVYILEKKSLKLSSSAHSLCVKSYVNRVRDFFALNFQYVTFAFLLSTNLPFPKKFQSNIASMCFIDILTKSIATDVSLE